MFTNCAGITGQRSPLPADIVKAWQSHDIIQLCKTETKWLFTWFNFIISSYDWLYVTCIRTLGNVHKLTRENGQLTKRPLQLRPNLCSSYGDQDVIFSKLRLLYVWLSYYKYDFRLCDNWKIRFQTRQFGHQWSCQNTCWVQLGHVSSAGIQPIEYKPRDPCKHTV